MPSPLHGTSIDHVELIVPDRQAAAAWYDDVLGLTPVSGTDHWALDARGPLMISGDGGRTCLALFTGSKPEGAPKGGLRRVAFAVSGTQFLKFVEYGRGLGLMPMKVQDHNLTISVYFEDPYGHLLEVTTYDHEMARAALPRG
jgi:catechol 2,3-dioxygenase-like lactoylglutathione lyase family enzyme